MKTELINGNYKATITHCQDGYGDMTYKVRVLCMSGTYESGDVIHLKNYATEKTALAAASRYLKKAA